MTSNAQAWRDAKSQFIESLRRRYESEGFTFTAHPDTAQLPDFLGSYSPDAIAQKPGRNLAIEVTQRHSPTAQRDLRDIRRLFEGHSEWQFHVVFMGSDPLSFMTIPVAAPATIRGEMNDVRALTASGHRRPAFMMAWSLLEAASRTTPDGDKNKSPGAPGTVVQTLAMNGSIDPDTERHMRALIDLRNRVVHGDLAAEPAAADIERVLSAIDEVLSVDAA